MEYTLYVCFSYKILDLKEKVKYIFSKAVFSPDEMFCLKPFVL